MAGFLGKLTGGGVQWSLRLASGTAPVRPGDTIRGMVGLVPERDLDTRALVVSLIGTQRYSYVQRRTTGGSSSSSTQDDTSDLVRQDVTLGGPAHLVAGQGFDVPFEIVLPADAPPSLLTRPLAFSWKIEVKLDVGGRDPSVEQAIVVLAPAARAAATFGDAAVMGFNGVEDDIPYAIWLEPTPLVLGAPFRGLADFGQPLSANDVRVELRTEVESGGGFGVGTSMAVSVVLGSGRSNVSENKTLWTGSLTPAPDGAAPGTSRYAFSGQLPAELCPTVDLPGGRCRATIAVVIPRRMRPDKRFSRPVALASVW